MSEIPADVKAVAEAMIKAIREDDIAYVGDTNNLNKSVMIDGRIDFLKLAEIAIMAERKRIAEIARNWRDELVDGELIEAAMVRLADRIERGDT